ncbi:hypothetical protein [Amycolatopsis magusensis]|uniref:hypothetical protein n=1 Tax=Amycolatopsis magusensis TaxID=882444 RepID=UPI00378D2C83
MTIDIRSPGTDHCDHAIDFGGLRYDMFVGGDPDWQLPSAPPPAAVGPDGCRCPSCESQGWYAESPICRYFCHLCQGARKWLDRDDSGARQYLPCDLCAQAWRDEVAWFHDALRSPRAAAQKLREQAARATAQGGR